MIGNVVIGDYATVEIDFLDMENKDKILMHEYENHKEKQPNQCASSISFLKCYSSVNFMTQPTQQRERDKYQEKEDLEEENKLKKLVYVYSIYKDDYHVEDKKNILYGDLKQYEYDWVPDVYVPFDYDGINLLWMEYQENYEKQFHIFKLDEKMDVKKNILSYDKKVQFVSHAKLIRNFIVYVIDHKHVKAYDMESKKVHDLYSHGGIIHALQAEVKQNLSDQKFELDIQQKITQEEENLNLPLIKLEDIFIASIDYDVVLKIYENQNVQQSINILSQKGCPQDIKKQKYIFDMGYPYFIHTRHDYLAFSSDFGITVIKLE
ncbi:hypothetical protein PPERSA_03920 [Pseudocohnilembus persalinus]|uniref:WD40-repeat-containing domain n=1 Tax=Pseudocohnilembus persalinus TaxID=266149 RepID=A0A0V0R5T3_PSEPJ|nr:hypothetical protein PPERSA_03920 [Pseudocohnilembus persalinus]|eukprot:KRX09858.1 hypothetical protein PPERSA_03920 [Pseudocohnilembus persalinus]